MLVTLWFAKHLDAATLASFVEHHRVEHERRLAEYRAIVDVLSVDDAGPIDHVAAVVEFGIAYEQAFLDWLARIADLEVSTIVATRYRRRPTAQLPDYELTRRSG